MSSNEGDLLVQPGTNNNNNNNNNNNEEKLSQPPGLVSEDSTKDNINNQNKKGKKKSNNQNNNQNLNNKEQGSGNVPEAFGNWVQNLYKNFKDSQKTAQNILNNSSSNNSSSNTNSNPHSKHQSQNFHALFVSPTYDSTFANFFKYNSWPSSDRISPLVDSDKTFLILYKELYYRHIYSRREPNSVTFSQRIESYNNYLDLFSLVSNKTISYLPAQWVWDIIDEFVYQYQSFSQLKSNPNPNSENNNSTTSENTSNASNNNIWDTRAVIKALTVLAGHFPTNKEPVNALTLQETFGYFSVLGLLRLYTLHSLFTLAIQAIQPLLPYLPTPPPAPPAPIAPFPLLHLRVLSSHASLFYHLSLSHLSLAHYSISIFYLNRILSSLSRSIPNLANNNNNNNSVLSSSLSSYNSHLITKKMDQMSNLLTQSLSFYDISPFPLDDSVENLISEKLTKNNSENNFNNFGIKYISGRGGKLRSGVAAGGEKEVRGVMRMYKSVGMEKIGGIVGVEGDEVRERVLRIKKGGNGGGFGVEGDMIWVGEGGGIGGGNGGGRGNRGNRGGGNDGGEGSNVRYGEWFVKNIVKFEGVVENLKRI
eukprot:TRINITY_DN606_c3_g1_i1.p1 TRINITY_DN606_c3_g1~~TRINITY_DN606_c3_g1_i1.p1  ORF type:complete len:592 (-),score=226.45 TRINITY_DN606_c3_g1_i1:88-1863(-)